MIDKNYVEECIEKFNMRLQLTKDEINNDEGSFDFSITNLHLSRECIDALQHIVNQMKQEEHDLTQDVYNKFKNKGYSKRIRFY